MVQDFLNAAPLREIMTSKDKKAWLLPIGLGRRLGSPQAFDSYTQSGRNRQADHRRNSLPPT